MTSIRFCFEGKFLGTRFYYGKKSKWHSRNFFTNGGLLKSSWLICKYEVNVGVF